MIKKLVKHGNSMALIINKPILDILHVNTHTPLEISVVGRAIVIKPLTREKHGRG